ncbi:hypothetical protein AA0120_g2049 [Alternaria tenuissima]|jgi:RimJ/RimL family protein N-acetyltransferase|nr:hypothetical protein AA0120_g2049 [Alternaria tenuissima]
MSTQDTLRPSRRFALLTSRLILIPTPLAISIPSYVNLYADLHDNAAFCSMGFGSAFLVQTRTQEQMQEVIATRDIALSWDKRAIGDFAVGRRSKLQIEDTTGRKLAAATNTVVIIDESDMGGVCQTLDDIEWLGYVGVRDATTTSLPSRNASDAPLPPWEEMVELRYGVAPSCWGQGVAREAAEAVMQWAATERGVKRFIAETEKENARSGRVLEKMGFKKSGTQYWKDEDEVEWERDAASLW